MTPFIRSTMRWMIDSDIDITEMQWFDISGNMDGQDGDRQLLRECRPPFEKCMVVWQGKTENHEIYEMLMTVVGTDPEEGIVISVYKGPHGKMPRKMPMMAYFIDDENIRFGPAEEGGKIEEQDGIMILGVIGVWYRLLSQGCASYKPVVADTFTNRRKIAAGKKPSYDWTTVMIEPAKPRSEHQGGTHASPRLHDRRGHLRRLRSGKNVWVKPCKVGDARKGVIFHDYQFKETTCH